MSWVGCTDLTEDEIVEIQKEKKDKENFAVAWLHWPTDSYQAALSVEPYNSQRAIFIAQTWIEDPYVLAHRAKLLTDVSQLLPTKVQIAYRAMEIAHDKFASADQKLKALRLITDMQGWTGPGVHTQVVTNNQIGSVNRVMEVPMLMDQNQWEAMAVEQQEALTTTYAYVD